MTNSCWRCDSFSHPRVCEKCDFEPACHDHNCWSMEELGCPPGCQSPFCACPGTD